MYDLAKRSLACTVATGGLLLTGAAFSPAMAAGGLGVTQGPAHAQEARGAVSAFAALDPATASGGAAAQDTPRGWAAPPDLLFPRFLTNGPAATRGYHAGAIPADSIFHLPIDLGRRLCDAARNALGEHGAAAGGCATVGDTPMQGQIITSPIVVCGDTVATGGAEGPRRRFTCATAEGSVPTVPDDPAPVSGGASATAGSTGLVSTPIQVPAAPDRTARDQAARQPAGSDETVRGEGADEPEKASSMTRSAPRPAGQMAPAAARLPQGHGCGHGGWGEGRDEAGGMCTPSPHHTPTPNQTCTPPPPPTCTPTPTTPRTPPSTTPPATTPPATTPPATTPPATTPPATTPPATVPITPVGGPSSSTPPGTSSTTPGTTSTPPTGPATPSASASPNGGGLAHTGADIEIGLAAAAATLIAGLGLRLASRRRSARH